MGRVAEFDMVFGVSVEMSALQTGIRQSSGERYSARRLDEAT